VAASEHITILERLDHRVAKAVSLARQLAKLDDHRLIGDGWRPR
jgi:hypothetical protein